MIRKLAVITAGVALLGFGLSAAPVSAVLVPADPQISLTKTVTTEPGVCGTESSIEVEAGTTVYYCYTVTNTGNVLFDFHTLTDDQLGPLFEDLEYDLLPDASVSTVAAGLTIDAVITEDTVNVGTWTACNEPQPNGAATSPQQAAPSCVEALTATATATASVTVAVTPPEPEPEPEAQAATASPAVAAVGTPRFTG
jgi:hypothetical protein